MSKGHFSTRVYGKSIGEIEKAAELALREFFGDVWWREAPQVAFDVALHREQVDGVGNIVDREYRADIDLDFIV